MLRCTGPGNYQKISGKEDAAKGTCRLGEAVFAVLQPSRRDGGGIRVWLQSSAACGLLHR